MYKISSSPFGPLVKYKIENTHSGAFVTIIPAHGGMISELVLTTHQNKNIEVIEGNITEAVFKETLSMYKGMKLFPSPNRIANAEYSYKGNTFMLPQNDAPRKHNLHGLVFDKAFEVISIAENDQEGVLTLEYNYDGSNKAYPFPYVVRITYYLSKDGFKSDTFIKNTGESELPYGDGWHPYLKLNKKINDLHLKIGADTILEMDNTLVPTTKTDPFSKFQKSELIGNSSFDDCFLVSAPSSITETILTDKEAGIDLILWQESGNLKYNYIQIYTPPSRDCIAIEPMTCAPDAFNNQMGLEYLQLNSEISLSFGIKLK